MTIEVESKPVNSIASCHILQQTPYWGYVKSIQGWNVKAFDLEINLSGNNVSAGKKEHRDDLLVITREIGDGAETAYVPYGPKIEPEMGIRGQVLEELSENLRSLLSPNCIMIRYDLPWESPWVSESDTLMKKANGLDLLRQE